MAGPVKDGPVKDGPVKDGPAANGGPAIRRLLKGGLDSHLRHPLKVAGQASEAWVVKIPRNSGSA